jgi:RNase adapter protein RapZ
MDAPQPRLVIITGMSGAGKSSALRCFEDLGFCCIDNLPPTLIETFVKLYRQTPGSAVNIAIVCDVRSGELFSNFSRAIEAISAHEQQLDVLFLDCEDDVLVNRFKAARRTPPLGIGLRLEEAIMLERQRLDPFKGLATHTIDTSSQTTEQLRMRLLGMYAKGQNGSRLAITILSFGFKFGTPADADFIFDTRFLRNPFYVEELRQLTGEHQAVRDYVMQSENATEYLAQLKELLVRFLPSYTKVNKYSAVIALGCTGGKHRSVTFAKLLAEHLQDKGLNVVCQHRDITRI